MFETSKDILNMSISLAVIALAIFLCWSLYYFIANLRRINKISKKIELGVDKLDRLIDLIKSKIKQSSSYLFLLGKIADKAMDYFNKKNKGRNDNNSEAEKNNKK